MQKLELEIVDKNPREIADTLIMLARNIEKRVPCDDVEFDDGTSYWFRVIEHKQLNKQGEEE